MPGKDGRGRGYGGNDIVGRREGVGKEGWDL